MRVLVIDVGGNNIKVALPGRAQPIKIPSGPRMTAGRMVAAVKRATRGSAYDAVTIGYPGPVRGGRPSGEPCNIAGGWVRYDFRRAFRRPLRLVNDAAMQALGSYRGGRMLFLGLGTGLGTAMVVDGVLVPLEAGHLPYQDGMTFEQVVGECGMKRLGKKKWSRHVASVVAILRAALQPDDVVLGGGNVKKLAVLPPGVRTGDNANAIRGGRLLWGAAPAPRSATRGRAAAPRRRRS